MSVPVQLREALSDPLLSQVERIFYQRRSRYEVISRDVLGEPGWDILLYVYMAHRKGLACDLVSLAAEIDLSFETTRRWVRILAQRNLLTQKENLVAIGDEAEVKLTKMFTEQLREMSQAIAQAASWAGETNSNKL